MNTYNCTTIVQAFQITEIDFGPTGAVTLKGVADSVMVDADYLGRSNPQPDGYYVLDATNYASYSPAVVFEKAYALQAVVVAPPPAQAQVGVAGVATSAAAVPASVLPAGAQAPVAQVAVPASVLVAGATVAQVIPQPAVNATGVADPTQVVKL
jgi:hypothetical protein